MHRLVIIFAIFVLIAVPVYVSWSDTAQAPTIKKDEHVGPLPPAKIEVSNDLLPDLVPLPPRDLTLDQREGRTLLLFSTTYFNQGEGTLELRADKETAGIRADLERQVFQRIYGRDGNFRENIVGTFLWHQEHLHYHFTDFIEYDLEAVDAPNPPILEGQRMKATFCLRDVSRVRIENTSATTSAAYTICGKELQGVSVGWGDTYYYNYPDQSLDISDLSSGTYVLRHHVNPTRRLEEQSYDNNRSATFFSLDMERGVISIIKETPEHTPDVEHIHLDDPFGL